MIHQVTVFVKADYANVLSTESRLLSLRVIRGSGRMSASSSVAGAFPLLPFVSCGDTEPVSLEQ